jgi:hypothetical protein
MRPPSPARPAPTHARASGPEAHDAHHPSRIGIAVGDLRVSGWAFAAEASDFRPLIGRGPIRVRKAAFRGKYPARTNIGPRLGASTVSMANATGCAPVIELQNDVIYPASVPPVAGPYVEHWNASASVGLNFKERQTRTIIMKAASVALVALLVSGTIVLAQTPNNPPNSATPTPQVQPNSPAPVGQPPSVNPANPQDRPNPNPQDMTRPPAKNPQDRR